MTFAVAYRSGGTRDCKWTRVGDRFASKAIAKETAEKIERMGFKALVYTTAELDSLGLPIGWEPGSINHETDTVTSVSDGHGVCLQTHHVKDALLFPRVLMSALEV